MNAHRDLSEYIPLSEEELRQMLSVVGVSSLEELVEKAIPSALRSATLPVLPPPVSEHALLKEMEERLNNIPPLRPLLGMGYYMSFMPPVVRKNLLENPRWYTQYTPYQAEISQGRLEALFYFQTLVAELTGMPVANASLLDEATACAEAMLMAKRITTRHRLPHAIFVVDERVHPQNLHVVEGIATPQSISIEVRDPRKERIPQGTFGVLIQYPDTLGELHDWQAFVEECQERNVLVIFAVDPLALLLVKPPGTWGADIVVGSMQRFGLPLWGGGPHAGFLATKKEHIRQMPGRLIGMSVDRLGNIAYRMTLQTREQHIRREKATSNICTAQVLTAIAATFYAIYHGEAGLREIAERVHLWARLLDVSLRAGNYKQLNETYFDTLRVEAGDEADTIIRRAQEKGYLLRKEGTQVMFSMDELAEEKDLQALAEVFGVPLIQNTENTGGIAVSLRREGPVLKSSVFHDWRGELRTLRLIHRLQDMDYSLAHGAIPLGSCTMKLNITATLQSMSHPRLEYLHPYADEQQMAPFSQIVEELGKMLCQITGFDSYTFQPASGAHAELTALLMMRAYFLHQGEDNRSVILVPQSAHGTNPASAVMAGFQPVQVATSHDGSISVEDLDRKIVQAGRERIAGIMVTYPSTHGVFEENIVEVIERVRTVGGLVYMDGANLNAMLTFIKPAELGAHFCHINLHKTFGIPHGGGGPGAAALCFVKQLEKFSPAHPLFGGANTHIRAVSGSPFGNSAALLISYAYIRLMGTEGLRRIAMHALLNANYLKALLSPHYNVLYTGKNGMVAHEFLIDLSQFKLNPVVNVGADDVAKRLIDYSIHAPTVSFPKPHTLMIEPTESEPKSELDRLAQALIAIREEIARVESREWQPDSNPLKNAPHPMSEVASDKWNHPYGREVAAFPLKWLKKRKFWAPVARINDAYGDLNLCCTLQEVTTQQEQASDEALVH